MKITVEASVGGQYNAETKKWDTFEALTVTAQAKKGGTRVSTTFPFPGRDPVEMLRAAADFVEAQKGSGRDAAL